MKNKKIKDYIYLNQTMLNSALAQYGEGLIKSFTGSQEDSKGNTEENVSSTTYGLDGILGVGAKGLKELTTLNRESLSSTQQEVIDNVLDDYAVDLLIENCNKDNSLYNIISEAEEGAFTLFSSDFHIYDFDYIEKSTNPNAIKIFERTDINESKKQLNQFKSKTKKNRSKEQIREIAKLEKQISEAERESKEFKKTFNTLNGLAIFGTNIFTDSVIIRAKGSVLYCDDKYFRINQSQLSVLNESTRKITFFGIISAIKKEVHKEGNFKELKAHELGKVPTMMSEVLMSNFDIIEKNDRIIKPIAIYFE